MTTSNHPAHGPVSLDRLHQIREILSKAAAQSDGGNLGYAMADAVKVIDGAIAAFGAEPVAWLHSDNGIGIPAITRSRNVADSWFSKGWNLKPLYTTPPATVSFPNEVSWEDVPEEITEDDMELALAWVHGFNQCRSAMLQAEPVSNSDELPLDYLQGHKDGMEWAAQLAEANHPQTGDWLYDDPIELARAIRKGPDMPTSQAGNSPVTPDDSERCPCCGKKLRRSCSVEGCGGKHVAHGLCQKHYDMKRWEDPEQVKKFREANKRFRDKKKSVAAAPQR